MTEPKLPDEPTPLLLILRRLDAGDHTVIPDDVEPTLWMREQIGLAANALTSALARVADMEGEVGRLKESARLAGIAANPDQILCPHCGADWKLK